MDNATESASGDVRAKAATAVAPDALTASLLEKHSAGEKLTPAEYGKLSWVGRKWGQLFGAKPGAPGAAPGPAQPGPQPGNLPPVETVPQNPPPSDRLAPVAVDASFVERTTLSILRRTDSIAQRVVGNAAKEAGAPAETVARFERAAAMHPDDKKLLAELSPECCQAAGINPKNYPLTVVGGLLGVYACDLWLLVLELKGMKAERAANTPAPKAPPNPPTPPATTAAVTPAPEPLPKLPAAMAEKKAEVAA